MIDRPPPSPASQQIEIAQTASVQDGQLLSLVGAIRSDNQQPHEQPRPVLPMAEGPSQLEYLHGDGYGKALIIPSEAYACTYLQSQAGAADERRRVWLAALAAECGQPGIQIDDEN